MQSSLPVWMSGTLTSCLAGCPGTGSQNGELGGTRTQASNMEYGLPVSTLSTRLSTLPLIPCRTVAQLIGTIGCGCKVERHRRRMKHQSWTQKLCGLESGMWLNVPCSLSQQLPLLSLQ